MALTSFIRKRLSRQILGALVAVVALTMTAVILLAAGYQHRAMLEEMTLFGEEVAQLVMAGIRYPMAVGDRQAVREHMTGLKDSLTGVEVFICDAQQRIVFATNPSRLGRAFADSVRDDTVWPALAHGLARGGPPGRTVEEPGARPLLVHTRLIGNQPECYRCHGAEER
ncbi:MAG: hypothetical protein AB1634_18635, partial [Thermodesulfobacteriota bacterium]